MLFALENALQPSSQEQQSPQLQTQQQQTQWEALPQDGQSAFCLADLDASLKMEGPTIDDEQLNSANPASPGTTVPGTPEEFTDADENVGIAEQVLRASQKSNRSAGKTPLPEEITAIASDVPGCVSKACE